MDTPPPPQPPLPIPPGKPEEPVPVLVARWMFLGCAATLAVLVAAFVVWGVVIAQGLAK